MGKSERHHRTSTGKLDKLSRILLVPKVQKTPKSTGDSYHNPVRTANFDPRRITRFFLHAPYQPWADTGAQTRYCPFFSRRLLPPLPLRPSLAFRTESQPGNTRVFPFFARHIVSHLFSPNSSEPLDFNASPHPQSFTTPPRLPPAFHAG